jgi:hypothetical protein
MRIVAWRALSIAVNPSRQEPRPFGLRGVTAQRGSSKAAIIAIDGEERLRASRIAARTRGEGQKLVPDISSQLPPASPVRHRTKSPGFLKDVYRFPLSSSAREMRNLPRTSLSGSQRGVLLP